MIHPFYEAEVPYLARLMFTVFFQKELPGENFLEYMTRHQLHEHEAYRIYSLHLSWMLSCTYEPWVKMVEDSGSKKCNFAGRCSHVTAIQ